MAPNYKDDNHLIIQPGSLRTLVTFGLEESLALPKYSIPTKVYKNSTKEGYYTLNSNNEDDAIYPIVKGEIVDINALNFLIKMIVNNILKKNPFIILSNICLTLVQTSSKWSNLSIESITKYVFETLEINAFTIVPIGLCTMFAYGSFSNALVIDIGYEKSEIYPIVDYQVFSNGVSYLNKGGNSINLKLKELLPNLSDKQIESLKKSNIFEVLSEEDAKNSFYGLLSINNDTLQPDQDDEGVLNIAAIVTSSTSTKEILAETEREKEKIKSKKNGLKNSNGNNSNKKSNQLNNELETNKFIDEDGNELIIGKERFQGCNELIELISEKVYKSLIKVVDLKQRKECYENIIIVGNTTKIEGLKESILFKLIKDHTIGLTQRQQQVQQQRNSTNDTQFRTSQLQQSSSSSSSINNSTSFVQVPQQIKLIKDPEYFSNWKKIGYSDSSFLGSQILSKQIFNHSNFNGELFMVKDDYLSKGPMGIWHIKM